MDILKTTGITIIVALLTVVAYNAVSPEKLGYQLVPGISLNPASVTTFTQGGGIFATSTVANSTLLASDIDEENVVALTLTQSAGTLTLPASSTISWIPNPGDTRTVWVRNASTSAAVQVTLAGGTGTQLKTASSTGATSYVIQGDTDGNNSARITFTRKANTDIVAFVEKFND